jgi:hypothetical protein
VKDHHKESKKQVYRLVSDPARDSSSLGFPAPSTSHQEKAIMPTPSGFYTEMISRLLGPAPLRTQNDRLRIQNLEDSTVSYGRMLDTLLPDGPEKTIIFRELHSLKLKAEDAILRG